MKRVGRAIEQFRTMPLRPLIEGVIRGYREHEVLTFASAIAFQTLYALIPLALCALGLLGGLGLQEQWTREWGPAVGQSMSPAAFSVLDDTVRRVLGGEQLFWMTAGAALAVWKVSAATRAVMAVFDRIYGSRRSRYSVERLVLSLLLGIAVTVLLLCAAASVLMGDDLLRAIGVRSPIVIWLRWPLALAFLFAVVALLVALAPADRRPLQWITFGSLVVVASWVGTSLVLGWYLTSVADYGSVFGALGTVVVLLTYLYAASASILTGAEIDALVTARLADDAAGDSGGVAPADRRSLTPSGDRARALRTASGAAAGRRRR